jgi:hypothetical protein
MAVNTMLKEHRLLRSRNESRSDLDVGGDMSHRKTHKVKSLKTSVRPRTSEFAEKSVAQWTKRSQKNLAYFKVTGTVPDSVFDFD